MAVFYAYFKKLNGYDLFSRSKGLPVRNPDILPWQSPSAFYGGRTPEQRIL
jgi:hypothetical protein